MSWVEHIRTMYAYNQWANNRVLDAAAKLSDKQLAQPRGGSYGSLANDLTHIVRTQQGWFSLLAGEDRPAQWNSPETDVIQTLRNHYDASHERLREYCRRLTDSELTRAITTSYEGKDYTYFPWQVLFHLANHGTQHRAEVGIALLELGASPGDIDVIYYIDELNESTGAAPG
jgi:uncharacterized damage-inducible protein DinB